MDSANITFVKNHIETDQHKFFFHGQGLKKKEDDIIVGVVSALLPQKQKRSSSTVFCLYQCLAG